MKRFEDLYNGVIKHEGYYANVTGDKGGETYMGVARNLHPNWKGWPIIDAYKKVHGKLARNTKIDNPDLEPLVKDFYYHTFYLTYAIDGIQNGSIQEIIFDWCVNSGSWGAKGVQKVLNRFFNENLVMDGILGKNSLKAINRYDPEVLFNAIHKARVKYYFTIAKKGENHLFLRGWIKRIGAIKFVG